MLLDKYSVIKENGTKRFAVIDYSDFQKIRALFRSKQKLQDYLDYLHMEEVKGKKEKKYSLEEVKDELGI